MKKVKTETKITSITKIYILKVLTKLTQNQKALMSFNYQWIK